MKCANVVSLLLMLVAVMMMVRVDGGGVMADQVKLEQLIPAKVIPEVPEAFGVKIEMTLIVDINDTLVLEYCKSSNGSLVSNPANELKYQQIGHWEADTGDLQSWASGECAFSSSYGPFTFMWNYQVNQKPQIFAATVPEQYQVTKVNHGSPLSNLECFVLCNLHARDCFSEKCFTVNEE